MTDSQKLDLLLEKMDAHDRRFDQIDERLAKMDNRFEKLEDEVSSLGMILENEIRRNIGIVAEGHMDLVRKMNEVLSKTETIEQLSVRVGVLESRMLRVEKQRAIL